jgi:deoxycytidylate deaminase
VRIPEQVQPYTSADCDDDPVLRPELVFGLVGPLGTDLSQVAEYLKDALGQVRYQAEVYRLSRLMRELPAEPWSALKEGPRDEEVESHMTAGNWLRNQTQRNDAVAMLGIGAMREYRETNSGDPNRSLAGHAHIFQSLKRPEEIETLRRIYGPTLFVVAAYSPRFRRVQDLARRIAESRHSNQLAEYYPTAERLLARDEAEIGDPHGQDVRDTFTLADVIVNTSEPKTASAAIERFIELLFGNTFHTPTRDEQGLYCAQAAAYRSASLARQVGACICRYDGSVVALGSNEVARSGGGQYWCDDDPDGRDFRLGYDSSDRMRENLLGDILQRLQKNGWLTPERTAEPVANLVSEALRSKVNPIMKGAQFTSTIDFIRAVHAEMAAITAAVRHGISTHDCIMFTTTFPCHDCAKHIVAAGINRVVYIEPYPKSLVPELYTDSIAVDAHADCEGRVRFEPFVGIAPKRYGDLFALLKRRRKKADGTVATWRRNQAVPTLPEYLPSPLARLAAEQEDFERFKNVLVEKGILREV